MVKHHSTISRRDFLKILGLGGVGLGAAAISAPVFHDLDEMMASPQAEFKRPGWVKEVDKPTVEVDWNMMTRFDASEVMWMAPAFERAWGKEKADYFVKLGAANNLKWVNENKPGFTLRDWAFKNCGFAPDLSFLGPRISPTPESLGVPRWEGTPEQNSKMVRAFLKVHGCAEVTFLELDTDTTEKLIYPRDADGIPYLIQDVDQPEEKIGEKGVAYRVIPKKARWVIIYTIRMLEDVVRLLPSNLNDRAMLLSYNQQAITQGWLQNFLRSLGYMCLGWVSRPGSLGTDTGWGVMAGLGETCRTMHLVTPEHGQMERVFTAITDLPLVPGKPVDFGVMQFCRTCKKCADFCPCQAIPKDTEPSWEPDGPWHRQGVRTWFRDEPKCRAYIYEAYTSCGICDFVCPFNKYYKASYHDVVRTITSATPVLNRFFRKMDDFLGYGLATGEEIEKFWELDQPTWGYVV